MAEKTGDGSGTEGDGTSADAPGGIGMPGGGPRRVVSETSVDDILESLESGPAAHRADDRTGKTPTTNADSSADDSDEGRSEADASADDTNDDSRSAGSKPADREQSVDDDPSRSVDEDGSPAHDETDVEAGRDDGADAGSDTLDGGDAASVTVGGESGGPGGVDAAVAKLRSTGVAIDDPAATTADDAEDSNDRDESDLSSRVDAGDVTGADVRAAEHGAGREPTPEVDELDLSLEDLEATRPSSSGSDGDGSTVDSNAADESDAAAAGEDDAADSSGLLGRLTGLFR